MMDPIPQLRESTPRSQSLATASNHFNNNNPATFGFSSQQNTVFSSSTTSLPFGNSAPTMNFNDQPPPPQPPTSGRGNRVPSSSRSQQQQQSVVVSPRSGRQSASARRSNQSSANNRPRSTSATSKKFMKSPPRNHYNNNTGPADTGIIGAKAAMSALQHAVAGERSSTGMALEKQIAVNADVKNFAVIGSDVWMAHADGTLSVRDCRTGHVVDPTPLANQSTCTSEAILGNAPSPWSLLAVTPLQQTQLSSSSNNSSSNNYNNNNSKSEAISITGSTVWVGFSDGALEIFDAETRRSLGRCARHHSGGIYTLACFSNNVFSGSNDFQICMWSATDFGFIRQFSGHSNYVRCLHAEGALLFSGSDDCTVRVWNCTNGQEISRSTFHKKNGVTCLTRVGPHMWSGDSAGDIIVWRLQTMREDHMLREHTGKITALKKVGRSRVYSAAADRLICVWDSFQHSLLHRVAEHNSWVLALAFPCSLTRHYVWTAAADATIRCFHHDEFTPMSASLENALEGAWYGSDYAPYRDLAESQNEEISSLNRKLALLQESEKLARERAGHVEMHLDRARAEITEIDIKNHKELQNLQQMKSHFLEFEAKEKDIYANLHKAQTERHDMARQLDEIKEENEKLKQEAEEARNQRDESRMQSSHMENLLRQAVKAQQESMASKMVGGASGMSAAAAARRTTTSPRTVPGRPGSSSSTSRGRGGSPTSGRGGGASTTSPRQAPGSYFSGGQRPLILVTNSLEQAKVVAQMEEEIAELQERCSRLQRVNSQMGRSSRPGSAGGAGSFRLSRVGSFSGGAGDKENAAAAQQQPKRDWASQALDIISTRQNDRESHALASSMLKTTDLQQAASNAEKEAAAAASGGTQQQPQQGVSFIPQPPQS